MCGFLREVDAFRNLTDRKRSDPNITFMFGEIGESR